MDAGLPTGTVTVLLGDIEGSARRWEADAGGTATAISALDRIVSDAASTHRGTRPLEQGEGDSFVVAFPRPSDAVACALAIQRALLDDADASAVDLRVRMALHTGEVDVRDDAFYVGPTMNRCGRLRALAHGGQVLLSQVTRDVVADQLPPDAAVEDLGEYRLRDLSRHERIHQLVHPALPRDFPPLLGLDAVPNNLPVQLTSFLGRHRELTELGKLLGSARMVTLTGSGGCGKTRLALHAAAEHLDRFPGGAWWASLAPLQEPALVANAVAAALGIREAPGEELVSTIARRVAERPALVLVLDNCEHLVDTCADLAAQLLRGCPPLTIVATSREPLGVEGEVTFRVPSLDLPDEDIRSAAALETPEATRLFTDRAALARPGWSPSDHEAGAVTAICRRLDGIPLAIELAAARIRMLSPQQIADGLDDRFRLLTGGARTALPRQRTLEASVDWSYSHLTPDQRRIFERLSVFVGTFSLEAAERVCTSDDVDRYAVLDILSDLVDRSLVQVEDTSPEVRYRLLETIRVYARQKLTDSGDVEAVRDRHLAYYADVALRGGRGMSGATQRHWMVRLDAELDNLRAALDWAVASGRIDEHLRLCAKLITYCGLRNLYSEVARSIETALAASEGDATVRMKALCTASLASVMTGNYRAAKAFGEEAVAIARRADDGQKLRQAMLFLGWAKLFTGDGGLDEIIAAGEDPPPDTSIAFRQAVFRAVAEMMLRSPETARPYFEEAIALCEAAGDDYRSGVAHRFFGLSQLAAGDLTGACTVLERAVAACRTIDLRTFLAFAVAELAWSETFRGNATRASSLLREARAMAVDLGPYVQAVVDVVAASLDVATGVPAGPTAAASLRAWRDIDGPYGLSAALTASGADATERGDPAAALQLLDEAVAVACNASLPWNLGNALIQRARLHRRRSDDRAAEDDADEGLEIMAGYGGAIGVTDALEVLGGLAIGRGDMERGVRLLGAAQRIRDDIGYERLPIHRPTYASDGARAREAVGDEAFDGWFEEGRRLDRAQAVEYARRGRGSRQRPSFGWESLTPVELEVAKHVADGLSNPQIAGALFISRNTVKTHVSHIFTKLGMMTRSELASEFTRRATDETASPGTELP